jgi:hypothetical protein
LLEGQEGRLNLRGADWVLPNADAAGYYRFDLDPQGWQRLLAATPSLPGEEAMAVADSVWASFEAGRLPFSTVVTAMRALASVQERLAATWIPGNLLSLNERMLSQAERQAVGALMAELFGPRLRELGFNPARGAYAREDADRRQLRQSLVFYVAGEGRDPTLRRQLVTAAEAALGGNAEALDPAYRATAFEFAVQDRGAPFMDKLLAALISSQDPLLRRQAAQALGAGGTPELGRHALGMFGNERLQNFEKVNLMFGLLQRQGTRDLAFGFVQSNFDAIAKQFPGFGNAMLGVGSSYCSEDKARVVDAALRPKIAVVGGGQLDLERSLAGIRQCAALRAAKGAEMSAALARR